MQCDLDPMKLAAYLDGELQRARRARWELRSQLR